MTPQNKSLSFFSLVGLVMVALKLREGYKPVAADEDADETRPFRDVEDAEDGVSLLDTSVGARRTKNRRKKGCCVCCGLDCGLVCKALGIVVAGFLLYGVFKLVVWVVTPKPTGLENQPSYSDSLGCLSAPYKYNATDTLKITVPLGEDGGHRFDIRGSAVGTFVIAEAPSGATDVEYAVSIQSNSKEALEDVIFGKERDTHSSLVIDTPQFATSSASCMRFDITLYVPSNLKKLLVSPHTPTHVRFDPANHLETLDQLRVTLFSTDSKNMILPHANFKPKRVILQVFNGWIVGDVSIVDSTSINTQNGGGTAHVRVHPATSQEPATLQTTTGSGRTDIFYIADNSLPHRQIQSSHISSLNGDVYLTYRDSGYSGKIALTSKSWTAMGLQSLGMRVNETNGSFDDSETKWTHWYGSKDGSDTLVVKSRGWTGLYF